MNIIQFIGTRPELIKLAPLAWAAKRISGLRLTSYFTGQHVELVEALASDFEVEFQQIANISPFSSSIPDKISYILSASANVIDRERPDLVIVQGDTISAFACALAANYSRVPVAHIEAGLRSFDRAAPWPEEDLRRQLTQIAQVHFAPTDLARRNLIAEGISDSAIRVVGNTVIDAVCRILEQPEPNVDLRWAQGRKIGILTMHRREMLMENGAPNIIDCVRKIADELQIAFIFPAHPSPTLKSQISTSQLGPFIKIVDPIQYPTFIRMLRNADLIVTDSGGIQEEATFLKVPTICLRHVTERPEAVASRAVTLVGSHPVSLSDAATEALALDRGTITHDVFGRGDSAKRILRYLTHDYQGFGPSGAATIPPHSYPSSRL